MVLKNLDLHSISLSPFVVSEDKDDFLQLLITHLPVYYDDVDDSFGESILKSHQLGYDPVGHFTKRKIIHRVMLANSRIGYLVVTEKIGGSIKIGPTILYESWRGQGIGTYLRELLRINYQLRGIRKAYSTVADNKLESYRYLVKSGYTIEAHLRYHYSKGHGELVFGQFYQKGYKNLVHEPKRVNTLGCEIVLNTAGFRPEVARYILDGMTDSYSVDGNFVKNLFAAEDRGQNRFDLKGKKIFRATKNHNTLGIAVTTAKRGGTIKTAPFIVSALNIVPKIVDEMLQYYKRSNNRKIMILVPSYQVQLERVLVEYGFETEGLLREPYKRGIDIKVLSYFTSGDNEKNMNKRDVVLSILPDPVQRILAGKKAFELRKEVPASSLQGMYLYTTGNVSAIQVFVEVIGYFRLDRERLWEVVGERGAPRDRFNSYFGNYTVGYGIAISRVCKFSVPLSLNNLRAVDPSFRVPMQFFYLEKGSKLEKLLSDAKENGTWFETGVDEQVKPHLNEFHRY